MPKPSYGGQAVIEGVMMAGPKGKAIAVRNEDNEIIYKIDEKLPFIKRHSKLNIPILRGVVSFVSSMASGMKDLTWAASQAGDTEDEKLTPMDIIIAVVASLVFVVLFFVALPVFAGTFIHPYVGDFGRSLFEGGLRLLLFLGYVIAISRMNDIKRVFAYHGAEHKTINAYEAGVELTPENVRAYSRIHIRCGTSFLLMAMILMIIIFTFVGQTDALHRSLIKILMMPVIAGLSYELYRLPLRFPRNIIVRILVAPGLAMQRLTTREPDDAMLEVAICALKAVPGFSEDEFGEAAGAAAGVVVQEVNQYWQPEGMVAIIPEPAAPEFLEAHMQEEQVWPEYAAESEQATMAAVEEPVPEEQTMPEFIEPEEQPQPELEYQQPESVACPDATEDVQAKEVQEKEKTGGFTAAMATAGAGAQAGLAAFAMHLKVWGRQIAALFKSSKKEAIETGVKKKEQEAAPDFTEPQEPDFVLSQLEEAEAVAEELDITEPEIVIESETATMEAAEEQEKIELEEAEAAVEEIDITELKVAEVKSAMPEAAAEEQEETDPENTEAAVDKGDTAESEKDDIWVEIPSTTLDAVSMKNGRLDIVGPDVLPSEILARKFYGKKGTKGAVTEGNTEPDEPVDGSFEIELPQKKIEQSEIASEPEEPSKATDKDKAPAKGKSSSAKGKSGGKPGKAHDSAGKTPEEKPEEAVDVNEPANKIPDKNTSAPSRKKPTGQGGKSGSGSSKKPSGKGGKSGSGSAKKSGGKGGKSGSGSGNTSGGKKKK